MAVSAAEGRKVVVGLYRDILRLHKSKLPPVMRTLGDRYVREEFKVPKPRRRRLHVRHTSK